jgi:hypothetical protein
VVGQSAIVGDPLLRTECAIVDDFPLLYDSSSCEFETSTRIGRGSKIFLLEENCVLVA